MLAGIVHKIITFLRIEEPIIFLGTKHRFFQKFIPLHTFYKSSTTKKVLRNGAQFKLNINDYMQWHLWAGLQDQSWQKAILNDDGIVIDVGTNVGAFALKTLANSKNLIVHTFEPNANILEKFRNNVQLNKNLGKRLVINSYALSNVKGDSIFFINRSNSGASSLSSNFSNAESIKVELNTLDDYVKENKITNVKFIKIDVEGFEPKVIEGAKSTIIQYLPAMFIEVTPKWWKSIGYEVKDVLEPLREIGYKFYPILDENEKRIKSVELDELIKIHDQYNLYLEK